MKKSTTSSFLLELPLRVTQKHAKHLNAHLEVGRQLYNALLGEAMRRLCRMRADPGWQAARALPPAQKQERTAAFARLRKQYSFTEYALHDVAKGFRTGWIADHVDSTMAQALATRAYQAANRVCLGQAKKVRWKSRGRGLSSVEGKWNRSGLRFRLQDTKEGNQGWLVWGKDEITACIDWQDPVVAHGLRHHIKYCRLVRRRASSLRAQGADQYGFQYAVQLVLEGRPYQKPKNAPGRGVVGLDLGPSTLAMVSEQGPARLLLLAEELAPDARRRRRLQRKLDRQRRANNPDHFDLQGRIKPKGQRPRLWKESKSYRQTRRRLATTERQLAAHRRSLHGQLANEIVRHGDDIRIEKHSFRGWQRQFGRSVSLRAPGRFRAALTCSVARTDTALVHEISTQHSKLSQLCHRCGTYCCYVDTFWAGCCVSHEEKCPHEQLLCRHLAKCLHNTKKPLAQRFHCCPHCGLGSDILIQRDLYSAWLATQIDPLTYRIPSRGQLREHWQGAEARLGAALVELSERARERGIPRSFGITGAGARRPECFARLTSEPGGP